MFQRLTDPNLMGAVKTISRRDWRNGGTPLRAHHCCRLDERASRATSMCQPYCASKHTVVGVVRSLALEDAKTGVTVNAMWSGCTDTGVMRDGVACVVEKTGRSRDEALAELTRQNPQGRFVVPDVFLCSGAEVGINGAASRAGGFET